MTPLGFAGVNRLKPPPHSSTMSNFCRFAAITVVACALGAAPGGLAEANTIQEILCVSYQE